MSTTVDLSHSCRPSCILSTPFIKLKGNVLGVETRFVFWPLFEKLFCAYFCVCVSMCLCVDLCEREREGEERER